MDDKAIHDHAKTLQKAMAAQESPAMLRILRELRDGVVASEAQLRRTKIGMVVNKTRASKDPAVHQLANEIVQKWRQEVTGKSGGSKKGSVSGTASPSPASGSANGRGAASPAPTSAPPAVTVDPEKRTWKTDNVKTERTDNVTRNSCIGLIYDGLAYCSTAPAPTILEVARAVEAAALAAHGPDPGTQYKAKMRSLFQNLKNKTSGPLRARVLGKEIAADKFVVMTHEELKSTELKQEEAAMAKENLREAQVPQEEQSISASLQCGKCGQKKVSFTQAQTRSADEPMTTFCYCTNCHKRWKVSALLCEAFGVQRWANASSSSHERVSAFSCQEAIPSISNFCMLQRTVLGRVVTRRLVTYLGAPTLERQYGLHFLWPHRNDRSCLKFYHFRIGPGGTV